MNHTSSSFWVWAIYRFYFVIVYTKNIIFILYEKFILNYTHFFTMTKTILSTIMLAVLMLSTITILTTQNVFAEPPGSEFSEDEITTDDITIIAGSSTINFDTLPSNNANLGTSITLDGVSFSTTDRSLGTGTTPGSQPNSLGAHVGISDFNGDVIIELPTNTCASDLQFLIFNPPFSAKGFDAQGNLRHTITSSGSFTEVFDFTGFNVHKVVIDGTLYAIDDLTFSPVSCSDPILDEILKEVKAIWMAIQNEIIPLLTNIDRTTTNTNAEITSTEYGLEEIKRELRIIEDKVVNDVERVSVTVNLDDIKLKTGEVMVLLDTTGTGKLSTVHVAANLPCNITGDGKPTAGPGNDAPGVYVVVGEATGDLSNLIWDASTDTGFVGPEKTCVYHASVDAVDVTGGVITDVIIVHPDNHPDADKKDIKKHEKLKGVVVTVTGTYN